MKNQDQIQSFRVAFEGICQAFKSEIHMKVHLAFAILALAACWLLQVESWGWCLVILCIGCVFAAEVTNTALEALCDKVCQQDDPLIKVAKDAAAGAVLVLAICSVIVGSIVYVPALISLIG